MPLAPLTAIGCMRLSTERDRDDARALSVLHAAFDAGIRFLDTADAYCRDATETGHNERLIAQAIASWPGDRSRIIVATKGGLIRPHGNWVADGRARHLTAACEASCLALGVDRIHLYQLHAPDPRTPFATSVRALDALHKGGRIESIGLCNVTLGQIEEARQITAIASVQIELSIWQNTAILGGVVEYCIANGIQLLAHRPLGGPQRRRRTLSDRVLSGIAARHDATPAEVALAWLTGLSPLIQPLPGVTHVETARSVAKARDIVLTDQDWRELDERFPSGRVLRPNAVPVAPTPAREGEIVMIMGLPGAGKSTLAQSFVAEGYQRLNRDEAGGSLAQLIPVLSKLVESGASRVVLDNTYGSRHSRAAVVDAARALGLPVRCLSLATSIEDAQVNAVTRIVSRYGKLLDPGEMRKARRRDVSAFGPSAQFRYQRELEPPTVAEGFSQLDVRPFERLRDPEFTNRALIVWCDGILSRSRSGRRSPASVDDVEVSEAVGRTLRRYQDEGWRLLGISWQPEVSEKTLTPEQVAGTFARVQDLLGVTIEIEYCPHPAGPPVCWCRKPLPGLGVVFVQRHRLDPGQCLYVGAGSQDVAFARRLGFQYREASEFFVE